MSPRRNTRKGKRQPRLADQAMLLETAPLAAQHQAAPHAKLSAIGLAASVQALVQACTLDVGGK